MFRRPIHQTLIAWQWRRLSLTLVALAVPTLLAAQTPSAQTHTVRKGDTLWEIAGQYLSDPKLWPEIYRLNTTIVADPHWIYPGQVLQLAAGAASTPAVPAQDTPAPVATQTPPASVPATIEIQTAPVTAAVVQADTVRTMADTVTQPVADTVVSGVLNLSASDTAPTDLSPLFGTSRGRSQVEATLMAYRDQPYRPLRRSEFLSSGFLSEGQPLSLGKFLGSVSPPQIASLSSTASTSLYSKVALTPPNGASYQVGDSLLVIRVDRQIAGYGDVIIPTGMVRVTDVSRAENTAQIIAVYGPIRSGQFTLPVEHFADPGLVRPVPISDGVEASVLESRDRQVLKGPQDVVFINKGKSDGVAPGDLFEIRRQAVAQADGASTVPEVMGVLQVVHVRDHSATTRVLSVISPDVPPGTPARQVAKLPS